MSEKYNHQLNVKVSLVLKEDLEKLAKEQGIKPSELVRGWIKDKINESKKRPGRPRSTPS